MEYNMVRWLKEANQLAIFTSLAEDLQSGLPWTNPASGQGGIWT